MPEFLSKRVEKGLKGLSGRQAGMSLASARKRAREEARRMGLFEAAEHVDRKVSRRRVKVAAQLGLMAAGSRDPELRRWMLKRFGDEPEPTPETQGAVQDRLLELHGVLGMDRFASAYVRSVAMTGESPEKLRESFSGVPLVMKLGEVGPSEEELEEHVRREDESKDCELAMEYASAAAGAYSEKEEHRKRYLHEPLEMSKRIGEALAEGRLTDAQELYGRMYSRMAEAVGTVGARRFDEYFIKYLDMASRKRAR